MTAPIHTLELQRLEESDEGTFGYLYLPSGKWYHTIELPWRDNQPRISRIPAGSYNATLQYSPSFGRKLYRLDDSQTAPRSVILIHVANWAGDKAKGLRSDVLGCIGVGMKRGKLNGQEAVLSSGKALELIHAELRGHPVLIHIREIL